jgi:WXG100 family type VII secretion target
MGGYAVDPGELDAADATLAAAAQSAHAAVGSVRAEAEALFATGWHGPAASAFRLGWERWADGAAGMLAALDEMASLLGRTGDEYAATEEAVRAALVREPG